jgi:oligopeptide transport system substrate-binding protein
VKDKAFKPRVKKMKLKRVLSLILSLAVIAGMLGACGNSGGEATVQPSNASQSPSGSADAPAQPDAPPAASGEETQYRLLYASEYTTLNYLIVGNTYELKAAANTIDGLTEYDSYGIVQPALAESWSSNPDNTVWTFKIRQGVKWVDKDGNEVADVTAQDWVDAAKYVNDAHNDSSLQYMYDGIIKNAQIYYEQTAIALEAENAVTDGNVESVEDYYGENSIDPQTFIAFDEVGVKALDSYTLEYTTESPCPFFISVLSYASYLPVYGPYLEEQGVNFGLDNESLLYNGAYILSEFEPNVKHVFTANPSYWEKEKVNISKIVHTYNADSSTLAPTMLQKGEIDEAAISADILDDWLKNDATKDLVRPSMPVISYSYFYTFNFEPRFDAQYEPENWTIAVNNESFRQALLHGLDRIKALTVQDPYNPGALLNNTVTPKTFAVGAGKDYTQYGDLKAISDGDSFNEALALQYRDKAKEELAAAGATFPIKALMPYNPNTTNWDNECQVVEQQLESLLGSDFIDIIVEAGPSTGFLGAVRRSGLYAFMKCNWGADYADPQTWAEPFSSGNSYNFMYTSDTNMLSEKPVTNKTQATQDLVNEYYGLTAAAKASYTDEAERFEAFAEAESFLINHAFIIPFSVDTDGYISSNLDPFSLMYAPYGLSPFRYKGGQLLSKPMSMDDYSAAYAKWKSEWTAAQAAAN